MAISVTRMGIFGRLPTIPLYRLDQKTPQIIETWDRPRHNDVVSRTPL